MADLDDDGEFPQRLISRHFLPVVLTAVRFAPSAVSICCAALAGYFAYMITNTKPPADISQLAVSILKSPEAPPELRAWAKDTLGLPTNIPMAVGSIKPGSQ